jgi:hypothetical protein
MGPAQDDWFLLGDLSIRCWVSYDHKVLLWALGFPLFALYVIGVPLAAAGLLWKNRQLVRAKLGDSRLTIVLDELRTSRNEAQTALELVNRTKVELDQLEQTAVNDNTEAQDLNDKPPSDAQQLGPERQLREAADTFEVNYGFLFLGFQAPSYYWEVIIMIRKALVSSFAVAFESDRRLQGLSGLMVLFVATILHARHLPFALWEMTVLEFVSLFVSSVTFFLGQFTVDAGNYGAAFQEAASVMALVINVGFLCFALWSLVKITLNSEKSRSPTLEDPSSVEMIGLPQEALAE